MGGTFLVLALVELTIAKNQNPTRCFFAVLGVLGIGSGFSGRNSHKIAGITNIDRHTQSRRDGHARSDPQNVEDAHSRGPQGHGRPREALPASSDSHWMKRSLRKRDVVCVVREGNCRLLRGWPGGARVVPNGRRIPRRRQLCPQCRSWGAERKCLLCKPVYAVSEDAAMTILDLTATLGVDYLIIGASQRHGDDQITPRQAWFTNVAQQLPESIHLIIYG